MNFSSFRITPLSIVGVSVFLALVMSMVSVIVAVNRPFMDLPKGVTVIKVEDFELIPSDRLIEPDHLGTYPKLTKFFARQTEIAERLEKAQVEVTFETLEGKQQTNVYAPRPRAVSDLPFPFWFQQAVGIFGVLMAGWVMSLKGREWGARMFALTGLFLAVSAMAAAVYSTRQIALPGDQFGILSRINHFGSGAFGIALVGLFMMYPRPIVRPIWLLLPLGVYGVGLVLEMLYVGEELWINLIISTQLIISIIFGVLQWRRSKGNQLDRAGLRWFFLFCLIGCTLFICLSVLPPVLGLAEQGVISQSYAFGFFNLMQIGLALGVVRWRVFDLDRYAYFIWLWLAGVFLIFATDFLLLLWLSNQPLTSLAIALVIASFLYFPLRQFLLIKILSPKTPRPSEHIPDVFEVALAPTKRLQGARWDRLLKDFFSTASTVVELKAPPAVVQIADNGLSLLIPMVSGLEGRKLQYADGGRRLFNSADVTAAGVLIQMLGVAHDSHVAYERGVTVERDRISRDVHDNIGAQLLSALHTPENTNKDALLRETLADLRLIISDGFSAKFNLADVAADLRVEMADRLEIHDIGLDWPMATVPKCDAALPYLFVNNLRSILREVTSNTIKHSGATRMQVSLTQKGDSIEIHIRDNGAAFDPQTVKRGAGLDNIAARVKAMKGNLAFESDQDGSGVKFEVPIKSGAVQGA
ncbi:sensor histidine kinase [Sulfitobacter donghicola]|uniref:Histidine kinase domain-containing protein n=1 Tax=Sulfitobacter donghicola DSW-25 = KCTC 12864 = JCM 14565 TaxID=1300350 RepID=A0A073IH42_9RHOB|nr:ATP-binding protein [Sulfitobacter donghicola]KEJ89648.1 hypothetical protein DSW25_09995 [Sulfitobacter donghicola DSW-25 = KCTC 12864 = JCM 14565]KIN69146.1 Sensor histidine kinase [Sulfitobacter donghicola DSW-25 = KCTC 12864 = JCM 14565]